MRTKRCRIRHPLIDGWIWGTALLDDLGSGLLRSETELRDGEVHSLHFEDGTLGRFLVRRRFAVNAIAYDLYPTAD